MKHHILIVDDEKDNVDLLFRLFRRDYEVLQAESGEQALEVVQQEGDELAVIVSDMKMPGMSGAEFLKRSIQFAPNATRIILSGYSDSSDLPNAINEAKVYLYLVKPFDHEKLKEHVEIGVELYRQKMGQSELTPPPDLPDGGLEDQGPTSTVTELLLEDITMETAVLFEAEHNHAVRRELLVDPLFVASDVIAPEGSRAILRIGSRKTDFYLTFTGEVTRCQLTPPKGMEICLTDLDAAGRKRLAALFA